MIIAIIVLGVALIFVIFGAAAAVAYLLVKNDSTRLQLLAARREIEHWKTANQKESI